jgi:hypothetical protein
MAFKVERGGAAIKQESPHKTLLGNSCYKSIFILKKERCASDFDDLV